MGLKTFAEFGEGMYRRIHLQIKDKSNAESELVQYAVERIATVRYEKTKREMTSDEKKSLANTLKKRVKKEGSNWAVDTRNELGYIITA